VTVAGKVDPRFEEVRAAFEANFAERGEQGAAVCVYLDGAPVVDLWGGPTYGPDTLQLVFSATKGLTSVCTALLVERALLDPEERVARYWPEFSAAGKDEVTVGQLLSHQAGLAGTTRTLSLPEVLAWEPVVRALEEQEPLWAPGTAHGYHALTFGTLAGELVRRVTGRTVGRFLAEEVAGPLGLDAWIGLPEGQERRVAPLVAAAPSADDPLVAALADPHKFTALAFANPVVSIDEFNGRAVHAAEVPAGNGICSARALARMYAACIGAVEGIRLLPGAVVDEVRTTRAEGPDLVLPYETRFALGFQIPFPARPMAGAGSFGHYGMGGSVGFALPEAGMAFGYTMDQMQSHPGSDPRSDALIGAVLGALG
jgi:CubicO group peptidase (beta-lactamase class C family)